MRFRSESLAAAVAPCVFLVGAMLPGGALHVALDTSLFAWTADQLRAGGVPYRDFSLEYPPGALVPIGAPAVAGRTHYDQAFVAFEAAAVVVALVLVFIARRAIGSSPRAACAAATFAAISLLALGPVLLIRFDPWTALVTLAAVTMLVSAHEVTGFGLLALSAATKLYGITLFPAAWLFRPSGRALWAFVGTGALVTIPFVVVGPGGVASSLERQLGRGLEVESVGASVLLLLDQLGATDARVVPASSVSAFDIAGAPATAFATVQSVALLGVLVLIYALFARSQRDRVGLATTAAALVTASVALGKVLSPQFLVWIIVLVVLVEGGRGVLASALVLAASALTQAIYPGRWEALVFEEALPIWLLLVRNMLLITAAALLLDCVRRLPPAARAAARGSCSGRRAVR